MTKSPSDEENLLKFLYAAPVGLVELDGSGTIALINPHAMKHLLPLAGTRDTGNFFAMIENSAPELRNLFDQFDAAQGTVCDGHRIVVDLERHRDGTDPKVLSCTLVKLNADRAVAAISDVTLQVSQERRLKQAEAWFASLLNEVNDYAVLSVTADGVIDAVNASWEKQTGYDCQSMIGRTLADIIPVPIGGGDLRMREQLRLAARDGWYLEESWHVRQNGSRYWCQRLLAARTDPNGDTTGYTVVFRDVARQSHDTDDLRRLLTQDHLTGAANRARFQQMLEREQRIWREDGAPLSLIMLDIDHFKQVNDGYGHPTGDVVLGRFAKAVSRGLRPSDLLARVGGEEFAVLLPSTDLPEAVAIAERLRALIADMRIETPRGELTITASLGCASAFPHQDLLRAADEALYVAKRSGRNRVHAEDRTAVLA